MNRYSLGFVSEQVVNSETQTPSAGSSRQTHLGDTKLWSPFVRGSDLTFKKFRNFGPIGTAVCHLWALSK